MSPEEVADALEHHVAFLSANPPTDAIRCAITMLRAQRQLLTQVGLRAAAPDALAFDHSFVAYIERIVDECLAAKEKVK
jgi:hypothetical protein